ncbi:MAG TPA: M67 family metallopeptidase [Armatimonadota bacterium]|jgi:proteasome lid subunit RPN8/RPN11
MLTVPNNLMSEMRAHGAAGYPHEVVGVMAGTYTRGEKTVTRLFRGANQFRLAEQSGGAALEALREDLEVEGSSQNRFFMTGDEMRAIDAQCRAEGIDIIGFYHTHPDHPARPSVTDLHFAQQTLPGYSYVIMSVEQGTPGHTTCWVLNDEETAFEEEGLRGQG